MVRYVALTMRKSLVAGASLLAFSALVPLAQAGVVPRDGTWGGSRPATASLEDGTQVRTTEQALFELKNRSIRNFEMAVLINCYNRQSRKSYDVFYGPLKRPSLGGLGTGLEATKRFTADDGSGRRADVSARFDYRGSRAKLILRVRYKSRFPDGEICTSGRVTLNLTRGPLLPPAAS